jgi:hypothetical protein
MIGFYVRQMEAVESKFMVIRKVEQYMVDGLGRVTAFTAIDAQKLNGEPLTIFRGNTVIGIPSSPEAGAPIMQMPLEFDITNAASVTDAFAKFVEAAKAQLEREIAEARSKPKPNLISTRFDAPDREFRCRR